MLYNRKEQNPVPFSEQEASSLFQPWPDSHTWTHFAGWTKAPSLFAILGPCSSDAFIPSKLSERRALPTVLQR